MQDLSSSLLTAMLQQEDTTDTTTPPPPTTTTVTTKALLMPELLLHIGSHLKLHDLTRCILVCRTWHDIFEPLLWQTFEFPTLKPMFGSSSTIRQPSREQFRRNASRIQRLIFHKDPRKWPSFEYLITEMLIPDDGDDDGENVCRLDQLTRLDVVFMTHKVNTLLRQNQRSLRQLRIVANMYRPQEMYLAREVLTDSVLKMNRLEKLSLSRFHIMQGPQGHAFLEICRRLKVLELGFVVLDVSVPSHDEQGQGQGQGQGNGGDGDANDIDIGKRFVLPRLRKLTLDRVLVEGQEEMNLWKACTHVDDLTWIYTRRTNCVQFPTAEVIEHLAKPSSLSMVQSLARLELNVKTITDEEFSRLLEMLPNLRSLAVNNTQFGPLALATVLGDEMTVGGDSSEGRRQGQGQGQKQGQGQGRRAQGWQELSMANCTWLTGHDTQRILTSCSALKIFAGSPIYISQMASHQKLFPIANTSILPESLSSTTLQVNQDIPLHDRPWVCSSLEKLDVQFLLCTVDEVRNSTVPPRGSETMRIRRGIVYDRLADLTRLQVLSVSNSYGIVSSPVVLRFEEEMGARAYGLDFSLKYELARLAPLKRLRELRLYRLEDDLRMGEEEFRWLEREFLELVAVLGSFDEGVGGVQGSYRYYLGRG